MELDEYTMAIELGQTNELMPIRLYADGMDSRRNRLSTTLAEHEMEETTIFFNPQPSPKLHGELMGRNYKLWDWAGNRQRGGRLLCFLQYFGAMGNGQLTGYNRGGRSEPNQTFYIFMYIL